MKPGELNKAVLTMMQEYGAGAYEIVDKVADEVAVETVKRFKSDQSIPKDSGGYRRGFYQVREQPHSRKVVRRIANRRYQLTHLLEYGHAIAGGTGRAKAFPHWGNAEDFAVAELEKCIIEGLENL